MRKQSTVEPAVRCTAGHRADSRRVKAGEDLSLYARGGERKYLNAGERRSILAALGGLPPREALFVEILLWSGARISEVLAVRGRDVQVEAGIVALRTLKRRRFVVREVPLPRKLVRQLAMAFGLSKAGAGDERLWPWNRVTGWRLVRRVTGLAGIAWARGSPRGMRHGFAVAALQAGVPVTMVQKWLGHARLSTTAIYAAAAGDEERAFAARMWKAAA